MKSIAFYVKHSIMEQRRFFMKKLKLATVTVMCLSICFAFISCGEKSEEKKVTTEYTEQEKAAQEIAGAWLQLVDAGEYEKSWNEAADYFKGAVSKEDWEKSLEAGRKPLGKLLSRTVTSAKYATSLPGAPDGEYVVIQYETSFENKQSAVETVTPMKDADGAWRVSGYYIK
jgi:hypothetical protein